jgi:hypothetical protein
MKICKIFSGFLILLFILFIFFLPYKKLYLNKRGFMPIFDYYFEEARLHKSIEKYESEYSDKISFEIFGRKLDIAERFLLSWGDEVNKRKYDEYTKKMYKGRSDKEELEFYARAGVPDNIIKKLIKLDKEFMDLEIKIISVLAITLLIVCSIGYKIKKIKSRKTAL